VDKIFVYPGTSLKQYKRVKIDPVEVYFPPNWKPNRPGSRLKLNAIEMEEFKKSISNIIHAELVAQFKKNGYIISNEIALDVLQINIKAINTTTIPMDFGLTPVYGTTAAKLTFVAELADTKTGMVIARSVDTRQGRDFGRAMLITPQETRFQIESITESWVESLLNNF